MFKALDLAVAVTIAGVTESDVPECTGQQVCRRDGHWGACRSLQQLPECGKYFCSFSSCKREQENWLLRYQWLAVGVFGCEHDDGLLDPGPGIRELTSRPADGLSELVPDDDSPPVTGCAFGRSDDWHD